MISSRRRTTARLLAVGFTTLLLADPASTPRAQDVSEEEGPGRLGTVTVTATRRASDLQSTPVAVTAITQSDLDADHVKDLKDLQDLVPALNLTRHGDSNALFVYLRGVGSTNNTELGDPAVAFHVNDVYSPRPQGSAVLLYDVERIEVLRGPQGTLFGRNATVGSINIHTARPRLGSFGGDFAVTVGDYDRLGFKGALNLPFGEDFALRLAAYSDEHDAYVDVLPSYIGILPGVTEANTSEFGKSPRTGIEGYEAEDQLAWRASAFWRINDNAEWFLSFEHFQDNGTGAIDLDPTLVERDIRGVVVDSPGFLDMTNRAASSNLSIDFGALTARYILGWANQERSQVWDADLGRNNTFQEDRTEFSDYDFLSHELTLSNSDEARLRWLVGYYNSREENAIRFDIDHVQVNPDGTSPSSWVDGADGGGASFRQPDRELKSQAFFGQATFDLTQSLRLTAGVRRIDDEKSDTNGRSINCGPFIRSPRPDQSLNGVVPPNDQLYQDANIASGGVDGGSNAGIGSEPCWVRQINDTRVDWQKTTGMLRMEVDLGEDVMFYGGGATGFKSGVIGDTGATAEPEEITNYEIGLKSDFFDRSLRLNLAAYYMDYENLQVSSPQLTDTDGDNIPDTQGSLITRNAAEATIKGIEAELTWLVGEHGTLALVADWLDAKYDRFLSVESQYQGAQTWNPPIPGPLGEGAPPGAPQVVSLAGNRLVRAPEYEISVAYQHEFPSAFGSWIPRVRVSYTDDYFLEPFNRTDFTNPNTGQVQRNISLQKGYEWVDASLRYEPSAGSWAIEAFVSNATDEDVRTGTGGQDSGFPTPGGFTSYYRPPRTYGVTFSYAFD